MMELIIIELSISGQLVVGESHYYGAILVSQSELIYAHSFKSVLLVSMVAIRATKKSFKK